MTLSKRLLLKASVGAAASLALGIHARATDTQPTRIRLIRNATLVIRYGGKVLLVDPMLADQGIMPAFDNTPNPRRNPLVPLPIPASDVLAGIDAVLVTHDHPDHWDAAATELIPKSIELFIQPDDMQSFRDMGFSAARPIEAQLSWQGIRITRTDGQHGRGEMARRMGKVSGYVLSGKDLPTIYIAGDTVWCEEVSETIKIHRPDVIVVNAGGAQFLQGGPIIMDVDDVLNVCRAAPNARVMAVHMEAINHCLLTRSALRKSLETSEFGLNVFIPMDGDEMMFS